MASFNKVILVGNLTRDPELRYTSSGVAIARISLAINRTWRSESGETKEEVTFVEVDAFRRQAETIGQYLKKGRPILIEGRLKLDQWEDKQTGQKRSRLGVVMETFQFLDSGGMRNSEGGFSQATPAVHRQAVQSNQPQTQSDHKVESSPDIITDDDDVPF
jgi:single-strand DNA-binding protein